MTPDALILRALRTAGHPLSVPELAGAARLSAAALEGRIGGLREAGYEIELQPHLGYRLRATPDRLISDDLAGLIRPADAEGPPRPPRIAREILVFQETGSTNDVAARMGRSGAAEGVAIFAERQTAGRGRLGRRWDSAAHRGLWFSLLLRPSLAAGDWPRLTTWAAVGVARGIEEALPGCRAAIKWPNDVYLQGRKAVGILIESAVDSRGGGFAVAGIGVNVNQARADFPPELAEKAISLREAAGPGAPLLDRQEVAAALLRHLDALYGRLEGRFPEIVAEAEARSLLLGEWVEIDGPAGTIRGVAEGLEPDGSLRLRREDGGITLFSGGEVTVSAWKR